MGSIKKLKTSIIIPARFKSSRFPGKPLKKILGIPLVIRVALISEKAVGKKNVYIATDSKKISNLVEKHGFNFIMTSSKNLTGTDRVAEASKEIKSDIFINVQGDEPLISPKDIKKIIKRKIKNFDKVICGYSKISKMESPQSNSIPKVVINEKKELIYISRSVIPGSKKKIKTFLKQICIYAFTKNELSIFRKFNKKSIVEKIEDIEILRFFELNKKILMEKINTSPIAVDYPSDIKKVENILKNKF